MKRFLNLKGLIPIVLIWCTMSSAQNTPVFGNDIPVTINGYTLDAMEPFLSPDGNALFFNSLNNGINTTLYYAAKVNDTVFNFLGPVPVVNQTITPRLDGVASVDSLNTFYWISTRGYPANYENVFKVKFLSSSYTGFGRVHGDFYIQQPGHLIMDAMVTQNGSSLLYCNAFFNNCANGLPCKSSIGIAAKVNDSTFNKMPATSAVFAAVNDTANYIVYAPHLLPDGLEIYYTRLLKGGTQTEVMVATRTTTSAAFSNPVVLIPASPFIPEAPTLSADGQRLYYHRKQGTLYHIFMKQRLLNTGLSGHAAHSGLKVYQTSSGNQIAIEGLKPGEPVDIAVMDETGKVIRRERDVAALTVSDWPSGLLILKIVQKEKVNVFKLILR